MRLLKTKVLVTGALGLLGANIVKQLKDDYNVLGLSRKIDVEGKETGVEYVQGDITKRKEIVDRVRHFHPKFIINAAAYTNVDRSEVEKDACWQANVDGVKHLAYAAKLSEARLVHISTDYVFDGIEGPYDEDDRPNPLGYYARSKLAGENELIASGADFAIARTMVLYGYAASSRLNFVTWVIEQLKNRAPITIVDDQFGNPTLADELAHAVIALAKSNENGVFHISGNEIIDRYSFVLHIAHVFGLDKSLVSRIKTADLNQPAPRPLNSGFKVDKLSKRLGITMSNALEGLETFKLNYGSYIL